MTARIHHDKDASLDPLGKRELIVENLVGQPVLQRSREAEKAHPIEEVGKRLRDMMSWIREGRKDSSDPGGR